MIYGDMKEDAGGVLLVLKGQKVKGPSNMATQFTQFCFICALGTEYNYILEKDRNKRGIQDFLDGGRGTLGGGGKLVFDQFFPKSAWK